MHPWHGMAAPFSSPRPCCHGTASLSFRSHTCRHGMAAPPPPALTCSSQLPWVSLTQVTGSLFATTTSRSAKLPSLHCSSGPSSTASSNSNYGWGSEWGSGLHAWAASSAVHYSHPHHASSSTAWYNNQHSSAPPRCSVTAPVTPWARWASIPLLLTPSITNKQHALELEHTHTHARTCMHAAALMGERLGRDALLISTQLFPLPTHLLVATVPPYPLT